MLSDEERSAALAELEYDKRSAPLDWRSFYSLPNGLFADLQAENVALRERLAAAEHEQAMLQAELKMKGEAWLASSNFFIEETKRTDERLAAAEREVARCQQDELDYGAEVMALREANAQLVLEAKVAEQRGAQARAIIERVAKQYGDCPYCPFLQMAANVDGDEHTANCPVTQAWAWLATVAAATSRAADAPTTEATNG